MNRSKASPLTASHQNHRPYTCLEDLLELVATFVYGVSPSRLTSLSERRFLKCLVGVHTSEEVQMRTTLRGWCGVATSHFNVLDEPQAVNTSSYHRSLPTVVVLNRRAAGTRISQVHQPLSRSSLQVRNRYVRQ